MHEIWSQLKLWIEAEQAFALATVVSARNPSPRGIGSVLAISADGKHFIGSVSAGCIETEVIEMAVSCVADGKTRWAEFGPSQGFPWEVAFSCGGRIGVRVERFTYETKLVASLVALHEAHGTGVWLSGDGKQALLLEDGTITGDESDWDEFTLQKAREVMINEGHTYEIGEGDSKILLRLIAQPYRLFIIGAGHISLSLVHFAKALNYQTIVIDPRESFAQEERFETKPDHLIQKWPEVALKEIRFTPFDSTVMLAHDPKIDDQALEIALKSDCSYVGALGSRTSHGARLKRLSAKGFDAAELERIHGPVGLDIGSTTPAEIAVSIVAEMVQLKNKQSFKNQVEDTAKG
ncbi:XdhC family protein [Opitutia bacterium ISCC 51]|nr:XdhC family protein [Opitutae bacterium ISCC 51]QXD29412.1 XdhC family protein [Opitutae bacterium ISCC 52]